MLIESTESLILMGRNVLDQMGTSVEASYELSKEFGISNIRKPSLDSFFRLSGWRNDIDDEYMYADIYVRFDKTTSINAVALCGIGTNIEFGHLLAVEYQISTAMTKGYWKEGKINPNARYTNHSEYTFLLRRSLDLDYDHPDFWFGVSSDIFKNVVNAFELLDAHLASTCRIRFRIPKYLVYPRPDLVRIPRLNTNLYIDFGYLMVGYAQEFCIDYGWSINTENVGPDSEPSLENVFRGIDRGVRRVLNFTAANMTNREVISKLRSEFLSSGITHQRLFVFVLPFQPEHFHKNAFMCIIGKTQVANPYYDEYSAPIVLTESN